MEFIPAATASSQGAMTASVSLNTATAANAIDGNNGTQWYSSTGDGWWWQLSEFNVYRNTSLSKSGWSASAFVSQSGYPASQAIDSNNGTYWTSGQAQSAGQRFTIDMGSIRTVGRLAIGFSNSNSFPRGMDVYPTHLIPLACLYAQCS